MGDRDPNLSIAYTKSGRNECILLLTAANVTAGVPEPFQRLAFWDRNCAALVEALRAVQDEVPTRQELDNINREFINLRDMITAVNGYEVELPPFHRQLTELYLPADPDRPPLLIICELVHSLNRIPHHVYRIWTMTSQNSKGDHAIFEEASDYDNQCFQDFFKLFTNQRDIKPMMTMKSRYWSNFVRSGLSGCVDVRPRLNQGITRADIANCLRMMNPEVVTTAPDECQGHSLGQVIV